VSAVSTCGWTDCQACAAVLDFVSQGPLPTPAPITSDWWQSEAAEQLYRRGVNLPPCQYPEGGEQW
jgi:hypothetical protein